MKLLTLVMIGLTACLLGCAAPISKSGKLKVVSTTGMIGDIVQNIGGPDIESITLMGPGVDPHLYKASEGDVKTLYQADIIFYNGLHLEAKMGEIFEKMAGRAVVVPVSRGIPESDLRSPPEFKGFHDPHVWFDVTLWKKASIEVEKALIEKDPQNKANYATRAVEYRKKLDALDGQVRTLIDTVPKDRRVLITAHDAFGYFGRAYGFEVIGLQGISTQAEAGAKDVQALANLVVQRKIPAIFVESSIPVRTIQAVQNAAKAKGWNVKIGGELFSDAMGSKGTVQGTYVGMVQHNVVTIVNALSK